MGLLRGLQSLRLSQSLGIPKVETYTGNITLVATSAFVVTKPSGLQIGDLMIVFVANAQLEDTIDQFDATSDPAGWTFVKEAGDSLSDCHLAMFWKIATATEIAATDFTFNIASGATARPGWISCIRISNAHPSTPIGTVGASYIINSVTPSITGHTTGNNNSLAFYVFTVDTGQTSPFTISGSGWTKVGEYYDATDNISTTEGSWGTKEMITAGATGTADATLQSAEGVVGWTFEVRSP